MGLAAGAVEGEFVFDLLGCDGVGVELGGVLKAEPVEHLLADFADPPDAVQRANAVRPVDSNSQAIRNRSWSRFVAAQLGVILQDLTEKRARERLEYANADK